MFKFNNHQKEKAFIQSLIKREILAKEIQDRIRNELLLKLPLVVQEKSRARTFFGLHTLRYSVAILAGIFLISGTVIASKSSIPGDTLYPLKRVSETVELKLTPTDNLRAEAVSRQAQERLDELKKLEKNPSSNLEDNEDFKLEIKNNTRSEISNAFQTLTEIKSKLESRGNDEAAEKIGRNLERLKLKAEENGLTKENEEDESDQTEKLEREDVRGVEISGEEEVETSDPNVESRDNKRDEDTQEREIEKQSEEQRHQRNRNEDGETNKFDD